MSHCIKRNFLSRRRIPVSDTCHALIIAASLCAPSLARAFEPPKAQPPDSEWTPLFDGRSFAGWEGNLDVFRIEDGAIVGGSLEGPVRRNEFLCTTKEYGDFELRVRFKLLGPGANAGIQFRSRRIPDHHEVRGYQADMGQIFWGCLYDESRRNRVLAPAQDKAALEKVLRPNDWNDYRIRCQGPHIQLWINDLLTVDYQEAEPEIDLRGLIGVQIHGGPPSEAWYKDLQIREL